MPEDLSRRDKMKIICEKQELMKSLNIVQKAVPSRTTMTILECILVDARSDEIRFTANDMELGIETSVAGTIEERGMVALDAKIFSDIVRKLPDSLVTISSDDHLATVIKCEKAIFQIMGKDGDDFSMLPAVEKDNEVVISQFSLREMIRQTLFSISANDTNPIMAGELMEINEDKMRLISLDGHRISIRKVTLNDSYGSEKVIIPGKTLSEISKILSGEAEDLTFIYIQKNLILFEFDKTRVVSRLIDGNYFRVDQMISGDYETKVTISRRELMDSIDRAMLMVRESDRKPIILGIMDDIMEIRINSEIGSLDETIPIEKEGKDLNIGFNPKYVLDALRVIDDENIDIYYMNSKAPCIIRDSQSSYVYLILPVNFIN